MHHRYLWMGLVLPTVLGCGGGGTAPVATTLDLLSNPAQQRSVTPGPGYADGIQCGDREGLPVPGPFRALFSFDLSAVPTGVTVTSAQLILRQVSVSGTPYVDLGDVVVDHVAYGAGFPTSADFAGSTLQAGIGTLSTDATLVAKTLDVTARVADDVANMRAWSQFRLRFSNADGNNDGSADFSYFETATNTQGTGEVPTLVVTYTP